MRAIVCTRGKRPAKKKRPAMLKVLSAGHTHKANSVIHKSLITDQPEQEDDFVSVWVPMKADPRFIVCRCCGKVKPSFGRPPKKEPKPSSDVQLSMFGDVQA